MVCTADCIVLVGEMWGDVMGGLCGTHSDCLTCCDFYTEEECILCVGEAACC